MLTRHENGRLHVGVLFKEAADNCTDECGTGTVCFEHMTARLKEVADLLREKELQIARYRKALSEIKEDLIGVDIAAHAAVVAEEALSIEKKCPSTYTHSSLGKLACEKDEAHLHRRGDVEHLGAGVKWMSL